DGLMDGNEVQIYFTNPFNPDTDGDGYYDGIEVLWGTNPLDPRTSLTTIFLNIAGGVLLIGSVYYVVRTQVYAKKHKEKIPKGKFYVDKKIEGYNALSIKKEIKPKPVYKPRTYTPTYGRPYIPPTGRVTPPDLKEVRNLIIYGLPTPKPSYSLEGQRALNIANHAFKLFNQGQYQASIQSMLHALMLGVPEPMNSHLKKIILDSLDRVIGSEKITQPAIPSSSVSSTPTVKCSICGTLNKDINKFCKNCGKPLERVPLTKNCGFCGASNGISNKFCTKCGREL
ncbi:MAG: zinc ribbon domain-containing protein, partial [Candidatus Heimdallarchaeota archaeon]